MDLSRRELLAASALLLARPRGALPATTSTVVPAAEPRPIVLCWNENPYGPSPAARAVMMRAIAESCRYPDDETVPVVQALAQKEGMSSDSIVTGTGSGELLRALGALHGRGGGEIIAAEPTYAELTRYASQAGATLKFVPVDARLRHDLGAMRAAVTDRTRAIYLCNPNNPTGTAIELPDIQSFVQSLPENVTTIVDEAYLDFADDPGVRTASGLIASGRQVVVLRTFSKIHGMAGVRCGYAISNPQAIAQIAELRMTTPNIFAMRAAQASLADHAFLTECRRRILASRARITAELDRLGLKYARPQGNFVFFDTGMPLAHFTELMRAQNILVGRRFPPYESWCRITIGTESEVSAFLRALGGIVARQPAAA